MGLSSDQTKHRPRMSPGTSAGPGGGWVLSTVPESCPHDSSLNLRQVSDPLQHLAKSPRVSTHPTPHTHSLSLREGVVRLSRSCACSEDQRSTKTPPRGNQYVPLCPIHHCPQPDRNCSVPTTPDNWPSLAPQGSHRSMCALTSDWVLQPQRIQLVKIVWEVLRGVYSPCRAWELGAPGQSPSIKCGWVWWKAGCS